MNPTITFSQRCPVLSRIPLSLSCLQLWRMGYAVLAIICHSQIAIAEGPNNLTVKDGLVLRLQPTASDSVDQADTNLWVSTGSRTVKLTQNSADQCPKQTLIHQTSVVRFDGQDDYLRTTNTGLKLSSLTLFIVAAPHSNHGDFRGLFAANAANQRDYESGFNIDLGPGAGRKLDVINIEGRGFGGAENLMQSSSAFGTLHVFETIVDASAKRVHLVIDGNREGSRACDGSELSFDEITLGARYYTNGAGEQRVRAPFEGDIAEVLLYDRVLSDDESIAVRAYLNSKYAATKEQLPRALNLNSVAGIELVHSENPPAIQVLVPGFSVCKLPVELTNCNNVRYRDDGKLITLGYNGDVHLLSDTNGDGLEDHTEIFWKNTGSIRGPIGLLLTPPDYAKGRGVFVASKGKVSLIVDTNGDDKADQEIIVASGWNEIAQTVDALAPTMDKDGNIYFGLGVANYANPYQVDDTGVSKYDINAANGSIQKVSADFSNRETVCTGIRFPVAMAFNHRGDLFCTEQEGATWLPNGNPLDELLHIRLPASGDTTPNTTGKQHFGFPPRHPIYNPGVVDEPSTYDFGPQHQSTCGMVFNEPVNGGPVFGPSWWQHDALVCGESRGKIWRTQTVKTPTGYVADSQLIACLQMLTIDACVAPDGSLVVACHSGPPDWGTGPTGTGKLFRIQQAQPDAARPVRTWAASPQEIHIAFDRPLDPTSMQDLNEQLVIHFGQHIRAGDRFETLVPPYAVVRAQQMQPRFELPTFGATLTADLQTIVIHTAPMQSDVHYAITLPTLRSAEESAAGIQKPQAKTQPDANRLLQHPQIDVDLTLRGVHATWKPSDAHTIKNTNTSGQSAAISPTISAETTNRSKRSLASRELKPELKESQWTLPHGNLDVSLALLAAAPQAAELAACLRRPGLMTLTTQLDLHDMLRPAIQPGASIDYEWPDEIVTVTIASTCGIVVQASTMDQDPVELPVACSQSTDGTFKAMFTAAANQAELVRLQIELATTDAADAIQPSQLMLSWHTNEDPRPRPFPLHRFVLPWVEPAVKAAESPASNRTLTELEGGSWGRGRRVFRSEAAGCFKCHEVDGLAESAIGPDLRNLVHRDYASVLRDIRDPSFTINPDYISQTIVLKNGRSVTGVLRTVNQQLLLGDAQGKSTVINREDIESVHPSRVSVMPDGIADKLSAGQMQDLLTYLLTAPPHMPMDSPLSAPPLRTQADVSAALAGAPSNPTKPQRELKLILVAGPKDHGPGEHDYPAWQQQWEELLTAADNVAVETAWEFPDDDQLATADVLLFFQKGSFAQPRPEKLDAFLNRGGGAVYIHWAVNGNDQVQQFSKRIGFASWGGKISYRHGPLTLNIMNTDHPIVRNYDQIKLYDESYWKLTGQPQDVTLLATSYEDGMATPQIWVRDHNPGRVFVSIPGHYSWTFDDPLFRILLLRGIAWTANEPVDRFNDLVTPGARILR